MPRFIKKPVTIEAMLITSFNDDRTEMIPSWFIKAIRTGVVIPNDDGSVNIKTLEGIHRGDVGDWIIQGVKGELYPCKPDIFELTYTRIPD